MPDVAALILAAGIGSRFGEPKIFAGWKETTFLGAILDSLNKAEIDTIVIVCRSEHRDEVKRLASTATIVINDHPEADMRNSLQRGLPETDNKSVLVIPVDFPAVDPNTYRALRSRANGKFGVLIPFEGDRKGHPILLLQGTSCDLMFDVSVMPLNEWLRVNKVPVHLVVVDDPGIHRNVNRRDEIGEGERNAG